MSIPTNRRPFASLPVVLAAGAILALALLAPGWSASHLRHDVPSASPTRAVLTASDAFLIGKQEMQVAAQTNEINLNPRGRYALITRDEMRSGHSSISLYDSVLSRTRTVWEARSGEGNVAYEAQQAFWLPQTDAFVLVTVIHPLQPLPGGKMPPEKTEFVYYDAARGSVSRRVVLALQTPENADGSSLDDSVPNGVVDTTVSPTQPYIIVAQISEKQTDFRVINGQGRVTHSVSFAQSAAVWGWSNDGTTALLRHLEFVKGSLSILHYFALNITTGQIDPLASLPKDIQRDLPSPSLDLRTVSSEMRIPAQLPQPKAAKATADKPAPMLTLHPLYLVDNTGNPSEKPAPGSVAALAGSLPHSQLIAPTADDVYLLPDLSAVLYVVDGATYAAPLTRLTPARYAALLREQTLHNAKTIGVAVMMYAQDYDETLPLPGDISDTVNPYVKDNAVFVSPATGAPFSYVLQGGLLKNIASPSTTVLGYLNGPGGRAVVYADGHAKWEAQ